MIKALAVYSVVVVSLVSSVVLAGDNRRDQAVIKMALGLLFLWVVLGGSLMLRFRDRLRDALGAIPIHWRPKFVLACTGLALVEEAITTTMTNLAPLFGVALGEAYITASANYVHVVLFHSVILFIPMFVCWQMWLARFDFRPNTVFLLFGITGSIAEASLNPTSLIAGFWVFVYGLMVYLPAYSVPPNRGAKEPRMAHHILAVFLPFMFAIPMAGSSRSFEGG